jgi:adenosylmethionine-8-amino-7-oxononanoate aminotransferase
VQGIAPNQELFDPLVPDTIQIEPDSFEALEEVFAEYGGRMAAFLTEPVQGAGGVHPPPPGYLRRVRELCDEHDAHLILDEVICAFGRLGTWFAAEYYDVEPDLITFAKAVTSGYVPLGGVIVGSRVRGPLESDPSFILRTGYTYSGHPAACAAGLACLDITEREGLLEQAVRIGERLEAGFASLKADDLVAETRGEVAVRAVSLHEDREVNTVRDAMLDGGAIARPIMPGHTLAYCPPLVITDDQIDHLIDTLRTTIT